MQSPKITWFSACPSDSDSALLAWGLALSFFARGLAFATALAVGLVAGFEAGLVEAIALAGSGFAGSGFAGVCFLATGFAVEAAALGLADCDLAAGGFAACGLGEAAGFGGATFSAVFARVVIAGLAAFTAVAGLALVRSGSAGFFSAAAFLIPFALACAAAGFATAFALAGPFPLLVAGRGLAAVFFGALRGIIGGLCRQKSKPRAAPAATLYVIAQSPPFLRPLPETPKPRDDAISPTSGGVVACEGPLGENRTCQSRIAGRGKAGGKYRGGAKAATMRSAKPWRAARHCGRFSLWTRLMRSGESRLSFSVY